MHARHIRLWLAEEEQADQLRVERRNERRENRTVRTSGQLEESQSHFEDFACDR